MKIKVASFILAVVMVLNSMSMVVFADDIVSINDSGLKKRFTPTVEM